MTLFDSVFDAAHASVVAFTTRMCRNLTKDLEIFDETANYVSKIEPHPRPMPSVIVTYTDRYGLTHTFHWGIY